MRGGVLYYVIVWGCWVRCDGEGDGVDVVDGSWGWSVLRWGDRVCEIDGVMWGWRGGWGYGVLRCVNGGWVDVVMGIEFI